MNNFLSMQLKKQLDSQHIFMIITLIASQYFFSLENSCFLGSKLFQKIQCFKFLTFLKEILVFRINSYNYLEIKIAITAEPPITVNRKRPQNS